MLIGKTSRKGEMNIYARIRKVINFDKKRKKLEEKIFRSADYARYFDPSLPPPPLLWKFFTFYVMLLYITFYFLSIFFIDFFLTMLCYNKMLAPHNSLIINTLRVYFSVCYFIPSQLSLRIFMQKLVVYLFIPYFILFLTLYLNSINILNTF